MTRVVFHHPLPIVAEGFSGSSVRPAQMLRALESVAEVWQVTGSSAERKQRIDEVKKAMAKGLRFDGVYAEAATLPTPLTDDDRVPRHPFMDPLFFRHCRKQGTPVSLFYRDVYWRFPGFGHRQSRLRREMARASFRYDLMWYRRAVDLLYLPSLAMKDHLPQAKGLPAKALPPATVLTEPSSPSPDGPLKLFYVGGLGSMYDIQDFVRAVADQDGIEFTICTRVEDWESVADDYRPLLGSNTQVVHQSGPALRSTMAQAHISVLCVQPNLYRSFAAPVKLFDGIGMGLPTAASNGTHGGALVNEFRLGWTVDYEVAAMRELFSRLALDRSEIESARDRVLAERGNHTWLARAEQVVRDFAEIRQR
ncbi:glycosyltransferase family protein [Tessaracoccus sp. Z1128]